MRTSSGVARIIMEVIMELTNEDLPDPVWPATSMWGVLARLVTT